MSVKPHVVVYDIGMPYGSSVDVLEIVRSMPQMKSQRFVLTTPNKKEMDSAVGRKTTALEIAGERMDLERLLNAAEKAGTEMPPSTACFVCAVSHMPGATDSTVELR